MLHPCCSRVSLGRRRAAAVAFLALTLVLSVSAPALAASQASIAGTVTDTHGSPLWGVAVTVRGGIGGSAFTDAAGHYVVEGLAPGTYQVDFSLYRYIWQFWQGITWPKQGDDIVLAEGEQRTGVDARLVLGAEVRGRVSDSVGRSFDPTKVSVGVYHPGNYRVDYGGLVKADGTYSVVGLPAGTYYVRFDVAGYMTQWFDAERTHAQAARLHLEAGELVTGVDAVMLPLSAPGS
jgi:hypothetical protein